MQQDLFGEVAPSSASAIPSQTHRAKPGKALVRPAPVGPAWHELAQQLPASLRLGGSTWSYPGWADLVWDGDYDPSTLSRNGLEAYHQHPLLRTVCVDRSFWRPLATDQYAAYAAQVDDDFRFVVKCPATVTDAQMRSEDGQAHAPNPGFLDPDQAVRQFVTPALEGLGAKLGVLVFQLSPLSLGWLSRIPALLDRLAHMLHAVQRALPEQTSIIVAVEVRDPELLGQSLVDTLKARGATFCLGLHAKMPPIEAQLPMLRALWPGPLVCRWSLNPLFGPYGYADAQKKHAPFNAIVHEDLHTRMVLARTIRGITGAGQPAYVTISNNAEGCAPLSVQRLAQVIKAKPPID